MKTEKCGCKLCKQHKSWERLLKKYPFTPKERKFLDDLYTELNGVSLNYEVDEAILDGSWPSARETLLRGLKMCDEVDEKKNQEFAKRHGKKERRLDKRSKV